jgi:hypothetical protein
MRTKWTLIKLKKKDLKKIGIINYVLDQKKTIKLYNTLALPALLYGSEN